MRAFLATPSPTDNQPAFAADYLAVDLEMSGLNAAEDQILSIGFVPIVNQEIILRDARHFVIHQSDVDLSNTAPIHKLHHADLRQGISLEKGFDELLKALAGKVLVLHHAPLDKQFLNRASQQLYGVKLLCKTVDTLKVERQRLSQQGKLETHGLRLDDCRLRYGLPRYTAHNATIDAIATAELWLAQLAQHKRSDHIILRKFV